MSAIEVTRLTEADWRRFAALRLRALADSVGVEDAQYIAEVDFTGTQWRRRLRAHAQFTAAEGDRLVGLLGAQRATVESVYLYSLWTEPSARRRGVARTLLSTAVDWARELRARTVSLRVDPRNTAAANAYTELGFHVDGPWCGAPADTADEITMTLTLS